MSDRTESTSGHGWVIRSVVLLPFVYLLSFGPMLGLAQKHHLSRMDHFCRQFYAPVAWLHRNTPLKGVLETYARFWGVT
jgi:hypothetical protein